MQLTGSKFRDLESTISQSPPLALPSIEDDMPPYVSQSSRSSSSYDQFRLPPPPAMPTCVPPLPPAWEGTERMSDWLKAKAEEDKRRQEEEKTRQANLVLEQRRVEQAIISDSLRAGVPAHLIPMIFNGIHTTGANSQLALDLQRQWSAPRTTVPPQLQAHPVPPSFPRATMSRPARQQAPQQPPQIPNAFENTFPVISSLNQTARSQSQSNMPGSSNDGDLKNKPVEYHFWTPQPMGSQQSQFQPQPPPLKLQSQSETPADNTPEASNATSFPRGKGNTKRKDKRAHEQLPPPPVRMLMQGRAAAMRGEQPLSTHKRQKSDISNFSGLSSRSESVAGDGDFEQPSGPVLTAAKPPGAPLRRLESASDATKALDIRTTDQHLTGPRNEPD